MNKNLVVPSTMEAIVSGLSDVEQQAFQVMVNVLYPGADIKTVAMVLAYCKATKLDPMLKPFHIMQVWSKEEERYKDAILPSIANYRIKAARTGAYAGKSEPVYGPDVVYTLGKDEYIVPEWCEVTVTRKVGGVEAKFTAREYWIENYAQAGKNKPWPNSMWVKRPRGQIAKCAEAQALRMAFPEELGSEPTFEEMEGKDIGPVTAVQDVAAQADVSEGMATMAKEAAKIIEAAARRGDNADARRSSLESAWMAAGKENRNAMGVDFLNSMKALAADPVSWDAAMVSVSENMKGERHAA